MEISESNPDFCSQLHTNSELPRLVVLLERVWGVVSYNIRFHFIPTPASIHGLK